MARRLPVGREGDPPGQSGDRPLDRSQVLSYHICPFLAILKGYKIVSNSDREFTYLSQKHRYESVPGGVAVQIIAFGYDLGHRPASGAFLPLPFVLESQRRES